MNYFQWKENPGKYALEGSTVMDNLADWKEEDMDTVDPTPEQSSD